eukprot:2489928-Prymnesium_polylepis.1
MRPDPAVESSRFGIRLRERCRMLRQRRACKRRTCRRQPSLARRPAGRARPRGAGSASAACGRQ